MIYLDHHLKEKLIRQTSFLQKRHLQKPMSFGVKRKFLLQVFAEVCRWKSYSKPQDTYLAHSVMDSIFLLFEKVETKHGWPLVSHALAYVTAAKNGVSETELEDLISLDDKVLDDIYQYHLPPTRRIPPLLWTRYVPLVSNTTGPMGPTGPTGPLGPLAQWLFGLKKHSFHY